MLAVKVNTNRFEETLKQIIDDNPLINNNSIRFIRIDTTGLANVLFGNLVYVYKSYEQKVSTYIIRKCIVYHW
jgi:hypothetical protein